MNLPIITIDKNKINFLQKNFTKINRYNTIKNKNNFNRNITPDLSNLIHSTYDTSKISLSQRQSYINKFKKRNIRLNNLNEFNNNRYFSFINYNNKQGSKNTSLSNSKFNNSFKSEESFNLSDIKNQKKNYFNITKTLKKNFSEQKFPIFNKKEKDANFNNSKNNNYKSKEFLNNIDKVLTKFKINKLISKKSRNYCFSFDKKNNIFHDKIINSLFNEKFINSQIKNHKNFLFGKNENIIKKLNKYIINIDDLENYKNGYMFKDIIKSLNEKDIKIILSDISYFKDINKNIVNILRNVKFNDKNTLLEILNQEDGIKKEKKEKKLYQSSINIEKDYKIRQLQILSDKNVLRNYEKHINKIINDNFNQRIKYINRNQNKRLELENINNICNLKSNLINGRNYIVKDEKLEEECFKSFKYNIDKDMTKEYFIEKNNERLKREFIFKYKRNKMVLGDKNNQDIIWKYIEGLKNTNEKF